MTLPFIFLWLFIAASVLGTAALWKTVRAYARGDWKPIPDYRSKEDEERRQRERLEGDRRRERETREKSDAQRRRDDARAKCELLYTICAPEISNRFSKQMLDTFIKNYMSDNRSAEEVEARARQLEEILNEHRQAVKPAPRFKNIDELARWYVAEKKRIEELPVDAMFKEQHLVQLHTRYAEMTQEVMERM